MGRGDRAGALQTLRLLAQHAPAGKDHARALLLTARLRLDAGDTTSACREANGDIATGVLGDVPLARDFEEMSSLCSARSTDLATAADSVAMTVAPSNPPARGTSSGRRDTASAAGIIGIRRFALQVASLNTDSSAQVLRSRLAQLGILADVQQAGSVFRVRVGPYPSSTEAADAARLLRSKGIPAVVVTDGAGAP